MNQIDVAIGHGRKLTSTTLQPEVVGSLVLRVQTAKSDSCPTGLNCCLQIIKPEKEYTAGLVTNTILFCQRFYNQRFLFAHVVFVSVG